MLRRKIYDDLAEWKKKPKRKALVIKGTHQVGKTFIIRRFAEDNYPDFLEINFLAEGMYRKAFEDDAGIDEIVFRLENLSGHQKLTPGSLIFFDEIQECPNARRTLKLFAEDGRYDVIASGSMLGVADSRLGIYKRTRPQTIGVGYEDVRTMYPLDFEEFLWARGVKQEAIETVRAHIRNRVPLEQTLYESMMRHFRAFTVTGGLPEVVGEFIEKNGSEQLTAMERILAITQEDINKYNAGVDALKTRRCFESIPSQIGDTNKKFTFSRVSQDYGNSTKQKYVENTEWLGAAGYGNFCHLLKQPVLPLKAQEIPDQYRIYLFDTGMLVHMYGPSARKAVLTDDYTFNQGAIAENMVAECLMKSGIRPRCYRKTNGQSRMELDFVVELGTQLCVIEVKSGKHRDFPSLRKVCDHYHVDRRIVFEKDNIHTDGEGVEHYPLFAAVFVKDMVIETEGFDADGLPLNGFRRRALWSVRQTHC